MRNPVLKLVRTSHRKRKLDNIILGVVSSSDYVQNWRTFTNTKKPSVTWTCYTRRELLIRYSNFLLIILLNNIVKRLLFEQRTLE